MAAGDAALPAPAYVATIETVPPAGTLVGAVYVASAPPIVEAVIVPTVLFPPATPFTLQFTPVPAAPLTMVAAKLMIPPVPSVTGLVLGFVIATVTLDAPMTVNNAAVVVELLIEFVKTA